MLSETKREFIDFMVGAGVLRFGQFTTKSGRQTPYFVNTGNYKTGAQIAGLGNFYADCIVNAIGDDFDALFGPAYKGIPLVTAAVSSLSTLHEMDKPFFFNRKEVKDHGEGGSLVGYTPQSGDRIAIVEDVITAGTTVRESVSLLRAYNVKLEHMFISVNRCEVGKSGGRTAVQEVQSEFGIRVHSLVNVQDIFAYLSERSEYAQVLPLMREYMQKYCVLD